MDMKVVSILPCSFLVLGERWKKYFWPGSKRLTTQTGQSRRMGVDYGAVRCFETGPSFGCHSGLKPDYLAVAVL